MPLSRRQFPAVVAGGVLLPGAIMADDKPPPEPERDYPAPKFVPKFAKPQRAA